jgi:hypothetical protein
MQMVLCDGKHFRAGAARLRRVALFFLDDATRMGLHVVVGKMIEYCESILPQDPKIDDLIDWQNKKKILSWLDSL